MVSFGLSLIFIGAPIFAFDHAKEVSGKAESPADICLKGLRAASTKKFDETLTSDLEAHLLGTAMKEFIARLSLDAKHATADETIQERILDRLKDKALKIIKEKMGADSAAIEAALKLKTDEKKAALLAMRRKWARETLDELPVAQVVIAETMPYLEKFAQQFDQQKKELFEKIVPSLGVRLRTRLSRIVPEHEVESTLVELMPRVVEPLSEALANEVARGLEDQSQKAFVLRKDRVLMWVFRKMGFNELEWRALAPKFVEVEERLKKFDATEKELKLWQRIAPRLAQSLRFSVLRFGERDADGEFEPAWRKTEANAAKFAEQILKAEVLANDLAEGKEGAQEQDDRLVRIFQGLDDLNFYIRPDKFMRTDDFTDSAFNRFLDGFAFLSQTVKRRVTMRLGVNENLPTEIQENMREVMREYGRLSIGNVIAAPHDLAKVALERVDYSPGDLVLDPRFDSTVKAVKSAEEREILIRIAKRLSDNITERARWFSKDPKVQERIESELYEAVRAPLLEVFDREVRLKNKLEQDRADQSNRVQIYLGSRTRLSKTELELLPKEFKDIRNALSDSKKIIFDRLLGEIFWGNTKDRSDRDFFVSKISEAISKILETVDEAAFEGKPAGQAWQIFQMKEQVLMAFPNREGPETRLERSVLREVFGEVRANLVSTTTGIMNVTAENKNAASKNLHVVASPILDEDAFKLVRLLRQTHPPFEDPAQQRELIDRILAHEKGLLDLLKPEGFELETFNKNRFRFTAEVLAPLSKRIKQEEADRVPSSVPEAVHSLLKKWELDIDELEKRNMGLIVKPIKKYPPRLWDDFEPAAAMALHRAALHFDPDEGNAFSTAAVTFIKNALKDEYQVVVKPTHISEGSADRIKKILQLQAQARQSGQIPTVDEILVYLEMNPNSKKARRKVIQLLELMQPTTNVTAYLNSNSSTTFADITPGSSEPELEILERLRAKKVALFNSIFEDITNERDRQILRENYGIRDTLEPGDQMARKEIAKRFDLSPQMIAIITNGTASDRLRAIILIRGRKDLPEEDALLLKKMFGVMGVESDRSFTTNSPLNKRAHELIDSVTFEDFESLLED